MNRRKQYIVFLLCFVLNQFLVQASTFTCNTTAACGCSKNEVVINSRIVGGEPAVSHSWGWSVSLRTGFNNHFCGGSIISPRYILTAAHCVDDINLSMDSLVAVVGSDSIYDYDGQVINISRIYVHAGWNTVTNENDIAILQLSQPISFLSGDTAKLCLPLAQGSAETDFPVVNSNLVAIGWGDTTQGGSLSSVLRQVTLQTVSSNEKKCSDSINNRRLQFCAAVNGGGKDTCQGDSGGPLMYFSDVEKRWVLAGVTSYGIGCGLKDHAGIYTRASMYTSWIKSIVGDDGVVTTGVSGTNGSVMSTMSTMFSITMLLFVFFMHFCNYK